MIRAAIALTLWAALVIVARVWGLRVLEESDEDLKVGAIPFYGEWENEISWRIVVPVVVGLVAVAFLPHLARRLRWPALLAVVGVASVVWSLALAVVDPGDTGFGDMQYAYSQHIHLVDDAGGPADFFRGYVENQDSVPVHLQAHPPGFMLVLWAASKIGLSGLIFQNSIALAGAAVAVVAAAVITRDVVGDRFARTGVPFLVLAPAAVWHNHADVVFAGVALAGVALVVRATSAGQRSQPRRAALLGVGGGVVFGSSLLLTFGVALLAIPIAAIVVWRRQWWVLLVSAAAGALVVLMPLLWGYWLLDGLAATEEQYYAGIGAERPADYFKVGNLAVFAVAVGPAIAAGLARLRGLRAWLIVGSGLATVAVADLSGLSSAETERIWQPFMPLVLVAGAAVASTPRSARGWLAVQAGVAVVLQVMLRTPW